MIISFRVMSSHGVHVSTTVTLILSRERIDPLNEHVGLQSLGYGPLESNKKIGTLTTDGILVFYFNMEPRLK